MSRIDPKSTMYGYSALLVRDVLRRFPFGGGGWWGWQQVLRFISDEAEGRALIAKLEQDGLLSRSPGFKDRPPGDEFYELTEKGQRIAMASARTLKRKTAEKMVREVVQRAHGINMRRELCNRVSKLVVFGSFMDPAVDALGDVDVAFALERKYFHGPNEPDTPEEEASRDRHEGPFRNIVERVCWPEIEVLKILKGRTAGLNLHRLGGADDKIIFGGPHKIVFPTGVP